MNYKELQLIVDFIISSHCLIDCDVRVIPYDNEFVIYWDSKVLDRVDTDKIQTYKDYIEYVYKRKDYIESIKRR